MEASILAEPGRASVVDVSQTIEMVADHCRHLSMCVAGSARLYHNGAARLLMGIEKRAIQHVWYRPHMAEKLFAEDNSIVADLAGNAFEGRCCGACLLSMLLLVSAITSGEPARNIH